MLIIKIILIIIIIIKIILLLIIIILLFTWLSPHHATVSWLPIGRRDVDFGSIVAVGRTPSVISWHAGSFVAQTASMGRAISFLLSGEVSEDLVSDGGRPVSDGGRPVSDGVRPVSDGGRRVSDGGRPVSDGGRPVSDGGRPVSTNSCSTESRVELQSEGSTMPLSEGDDRTVPHSARGSYRVSMYAQTIVQPLRSFYRGRWSWRGYRVGANRKRSCTEVS